MKKNCLDPERQQMLTEYIQSLTTSSVNYDNRGKYIDAVYRFLDSAEEVSRRGWKRWKKAHAEELIYMPWVQDAVCNLLASRGIGYKPKREQPGKARYIDKIEKRDVRQTETINNFLLWLENEREYSPNTLRIYSYSVRDFFSYFDEFNQDNARRYIAALEEKGNNPKTIRLRITSLEKLGDYLKKPVKLKRPKIQKTLSVENIPTEAEYNKLLAYCDEHAPKWAYIIRLLGTTGCRVSELIQFTYEQIQAGSCDLKGKGSKYRRFFFTKQVQERLRLYEPLRLADQHTRHSSGTEKPRHEVRHCQREDAPPRLPTLLCQDVPKENKRRCFAGRHTGPRQRRYYTNLFAEKL